MNISYFNRNNHVLYTIVYPDFRTASKDKPVFLSFATEYTKNTDLLLHTYAAKLAYVCSCGCIRV
jgi:hypothetical protein